jgi:hypothetical protein
MTEAEAKRRFVILNLVRLSALIFVFVGAANIGGKLMPEAAPTLGYVLLILGAIDFFVAPVLLKRMWRTPDQ